MSKVVGVLVVSIWLTNEVSRNKKREQEIEEKPESTKEKGVL
jgi:hypothetical protein